MSWLLLNVIFSTQSEFSNWLIGPFTIYKSSMFLKIMQTVLDQMFMFPHLNAPYSIFTSYPQVACCALKSTNK